MVIRHFYLILIGAIFLSNVVDAQNSPVLFREVELKIDTATYQLSRNFITVDNTKKLYFYFDNNEEVAEIKLFPVNFRETEGLRLIASADFKVIDSLLNFNNQYYKFKVQFKNITRSDFLAFTFVVPSKTDGQPDLIKEVGLFPVTETKVNLNLTTDELFIGEEKIFEAVVSNPQNIRTNTEWTKGNEIDYRVSEKNDQVLIHLLPNQYGRRSSTIILKTYKPYLNERFEPMYTLPTINYPFYIKSSRLAFLNTDKSEVSMDENSRKEGTEIQIDNNRNLQVQKTYRIESQEEKGGALIAELFTRSNLSNDRVLCWLRVYSLHRKSEGYLYIKDGDEAKFITNLDITPKTNIVSVSILTDGGDWNNNLVVHPGETIELRITGEGLHKAQFNVEDLVDITSAADSMLRNDKTMTYKLRVPIEIKKKSVTLYNYSNPTSYSISVKEFQQPRPFDFVFLNYGDKSRRVSQINDYIVYGKTVKDIILTFDENRIDSKEKIYGKQYLTIDVKVTGRRNELIDMKTIKNVVACPGVTSPRSNYYNNKDCNPEGIKLNDYLSTKTYDIDDWAKIRLEIKHQGDKYTEEGYDKVIDMVLQKKYLFDIDVSFPAGLLMKKAGVDGYGGFGGISMAMIAQFSFYHPEKIGKIRPYKIGAGFLALNAFNFSENNTGRDLGVVILGSIYPSTKSQKLSFPLFLGGGYLLTEGRMFFLLGPGIRVSL